MSLNREMLQVARLAPQALGEATELVATFLNSLANDDGGYADRDGKSDLYYTSFAVAGLVALQQPLPTARLAGYLARAALSPDLDLVHQACLARCWSLLPPGDRPPIDTERMLAATAALRTPDGGFNSVPGTSYGDLYGAFLAMGLYEDLGAEVPRQDELLQFVLALRQPDGSYANSRELPIGLTTSSAAAASLLRHLGHPPDAALAHWLVARLHGEGGFVAGYDVPIPDLLSTATALHALTSLKVNLAPLREPCLDYIDTLWTARGGFYGSWEDDHLDSEYTYYGLLALGNLCV